MQLKQVGENISAVEILNISPHGFWLMVNGKEFFLDFDHFPWFRNATISSVLNVELPQSHHLYWPDLDIDLDLDSIRFPEKYPLVDALNLRQDSVST